MLKEFRNVMQHRGDPFRRIYCDDYFDLYVWFDSEDKILGIQLCYDYQNDGRALTFLDGKYSHNAIDVGEGSPLKNLSPILVADGVFPKQMIAKRFEGESLKLPVEVAAYVKKVITGFPEKS